MRILTCALLVAPVLFAAAANASPSPQLAQAGTPSIASCGDLVYGSGASSGAAVTQALSCFENAFSRCQSSALNVTYSSTAGTVQRVFLVQQQDEGCAVIESVQRQSGQSNVAQTYQCGDVRRQPEGLMVTKCSNGEQRLIPVDTGTSAAASLN